VSQPEASPRDERPCFDLFAEDEEVCYEAEIGNARFSLKYRRDKSSSWPDLSSGLTRGLSRPSTSLIFWRRIVDARDKRGHDKEV